MSQPKEPPVSIRPGATRLAEVDAFAADHGLNRHAALMALIDLGLGKGAPVAAPPPKPPATTPAPKVRKAAAEPQEAPRERFTMDDVRPKFTPRLKNR